MNMESERLFEDNFIPKFFKNTDIFVTGGSGVVGKALIEKLLRSCDVHRIFVLLRPKKTQSIEQRLQGLFEDKIFRRLKNEGRESELDKIIAVPGDAMLPNLGITPECAKQMEHVSIIFHCAATVAFNEHMKLALRLNVGGVLEALKFAETLENLKCFMHVSTYFSNPYRSYTEPKVYESPMDWKLCMRLLEDDVDPRILDTLTRKMIIGFPNTYTFTKNIAESLVNSYRDRLPVVIYRPSIVIFAISEPEPGYPPSMMGAMGLFVLMFTGILKIVLISKHTRLDLTPMDLCVKAMCFYAYRGAEIYNKRKSLGLPPPESAPVYLSSSSQHTKQSFHDMVDDIQNHNCCFYAPFEKCLLYPSTYLTSCRYYYNLGVYSMQLIPGLIADILLKLFGIKPAVLSAMRRAYMALEVMEPFRFNNFDSPGTTEYDLMKRELSHTDFAITDDLDYAIQKVGSVACTMHMSAKVREILLNEDPKSIPKCRTVLQYKYVIFTILKYWFLYTMLRLLWNVLYKSFL